jgi:hypothetical protein
MCRDASLVSGAPGDDSYNLCRVGTRLHEGRVRRSHPPLPSVGSQLQLPALAAHILLSSGMKPPARLSGMELPWTSGAVEVYP